MNGTGREASIHTDESGLGLMEVIVGVLVMLILGSILLHLIHIGFAMYKLNVATSGVAERLEIARTMAMNRKESVSVIFESKEKRFGVDRNSNGRLDNIEAQELPEGVNITSDATVIFSRTGKLNPGSKEPKIEITNTRGSRRVTVSSLGAIEID
jgi:hypothetical protein